MTKHEPISGEIERTDAGTFPKGVSGNPVGRPKGAKNKITLLRQSLELQLRETAAPDMIGVLNKAVELALEGDRTMIKLLLEMHMSKSSGEEAKATERVAIQINNLAKETAEIIDITDNNEVEIDG